MPHATADDGARIFHRVDGPGDGPVLLMSNSLGTTLEMWDGQAGALATAGFRVLRHDGRGHGRSDAPPEAYDVARLGRDALAVLDARGIDRAHVCGLSMGGMVAMWLAANAPGRVDRLVLANTSAAIGSPEVWDQRIATVRREGVAALVPGVIDRWFTKPFQERAPETVERIAAMLRAAPAEGYAACCAAVRDHDQTAALASIASPTLVIGGAHDAATPMAHARLIAAAVPGARLVELDAAHLSNVEQEGAFTRALLDFLGRADGP